MFEFEDDLVPNDEFPDEGFSVGPGREFNDLDRDRNFGRQTNRPTQPEFIRRRTRRVKEQHKVFLHLIMIQLLKRKSMEIMYNKTYKK